MVKNYSSSCPAELAACESHGMSQGKIANVVSTAYLCSIVVHAETPQIRRARQEQKVASYYSSHAVGIING
jgi:hypothetical protein